MFAFLYLALMWFVGDAVARRIFAFLSIQHRLAVSFLTGLVLSTVVTYLFALLFSATASPLLWANLLFLIAAVLILYLLRGGSPESQPGNGAIKRIFRFIGPAGSDDIHQDGPQESDSTASQIPIRLDADRRPPGRTTWDVVFLAGCAAVGLWLIWATLSFSNGSFEFALKSWSDFGANLSLAQSFALGSNFPTEHPFYPGEPIRYHFLFWFQCANFAFLGQNLVWAVNLLSFLSLMALLVLITTIAELVFGTRSVGRLSIILFFFASSALSYIPFLTSQENLATALDSIFHRTTYLVSGYPYRGEDWGALGVTVFSNQRHFISGVGVLFTCLAFLIDFYKRSGLFGTLAPEAEEPAEQTLETVREIDDAPERHVAVDETDEQRPLELPALTGFILCGVLIGLMPYWNSAVYLSSMIVFGGFFVFFGLRRKLLSMIAIAVAIGFPQVLFLGSANAAGATSSLFNWGYTIPNPTIFKILAFIGWTFGIKLLLAGFALFTVGRPQKYLFLIFSLLVPVAFAFQFSVDVFNNHKLLNIWNLVAIIYASYALCVIAQGNLVRRAVAVVLAIIMCAGAAIDLVPIHNDVSITVPHNGDRLTTWILENSKPHDIFLSDTVLAHPILFSGRKVFLGNTLFPWAVGYDVASREKLYKQMFQQKDPAKLNRLLSDNSISFVAFDDAVRSNASLSNLNEPVFQRSFEQVFLDPEGKYGHLAIYRVEPRAAGDEASGVSPATVDPFDGGQGTASGQFANPRGITVDKAGNFYVADTMNARIQKFGSDGTFLATVGSSGAGPGSLREPNGVAVDEKGNVFVADALNQRVVKFAGDGAFEREWDGPDTKFFGPRALAFGPDGQLLILDQGNARVVILDTGSGAFREWGTKGNAPGQLNEPTGIDVSGGKVYVTDTGNQRIQIFDLAGKLLAEWPVPEWETYPWQYPDIAVDEAAKRIYVTRPLAKQIMVFDPTGKRLDPLVSDATNQMENPSALAIGTSGADRVLYVVNTGSSKVAKFKVP